MAKRARRKTTGLRSHSREGQSYPVASVYDVDLTPVKDRQGPLSKMVAGMMLLLSIWFLYAMFGDSRFRVKQMTIQGTRCVSEEEARGALINMSGSIFRVNTEKSEEMLLDSFGCLERVQVTCKLPDRVEVTLQPHDDLLIWETDDSTWWVDHQGRILGEAGFFADEVVIEDTVGISTTIGNTITEVPWQLALDMAQAMPSAQRFLYVPDRGLVIHVTSKGWPVYLGRQGDAREKARLLRALSSHLISQGTDAKLIDLRCERQATFVKR